MTRWLRKSTSPWTWPMVTLVFLIAFVAVGSVLAILLAGCAAQPGTQGTSESGDSGTVSQKTSSTGFAESHITLSDGRDITCITWSDYSLMTESNSSGMSCDWEPEKAE